jgi:hypothetical protein
MDREKMQWERLAACHVTLRNLNPELESTIFPTAHRINIIFFLPFNFTDLVQIIPCKASSLVRRSLPTPSTVMEEYGREEAKDRERERARGRPRAGSDRYGTQSIDPTYSAYPCRLSIPFFPLRAVPTPARNPYGK